MPELIFPTTEALQDKIVTEADGRTLILTSGGRLARQLRHAFRLHRRGKGLRGWQRPQILSLNAWIEKIWQDSWPEEVSPSVLKILRLWEEAVKETDLPEGLTADIHLYQILDETYQARIRNKVPTPGNSYLTPLLSWREAVFKRFEVLLLDYGLIHPVLLPLKILQGITSGTQRFPGKIFLTGFEFPAPIEKDLLQGLSRKGGALLCSTRSIQAPFLSAVCLPNLEEEVVWLAEQILLTARQTPLHRIGLIVPTLSQYAPFLASAFQELIGPTINEDGGNYNISLGKPLWEQPLVQAGLLPLRFMLEGQSRTVFLSLLLSPFYSVWKVHHDDLAQADRLWRTHSVDKGLEALLSCLRQHNFRRFSLINPGDFSLEGLLNGFLIKEQSGADWVKVLLDCWRVLGYPAIEGPGEEGFYRHFLEILRIVGDDLRTISLKGSEFYSWLKSLLRQTLVNDPGHEQAGIQILGLIEARGLTFDHLYLAGLSKGSLPQAVRTFPFLSPEERRLVQGATLKSQYEFARAAFAHLQTVSPKLSLTRPKEEKGDLLPPSPFWPVLEEMEERNIWKIPGRVWVRAEWLKQTALGRPRYSQPYPREDSPVNQIARTTSLSVSALESFLACPFKYYAEQLLALTPLEEITIGISPSQRGEMLHTLLALITETIRQKGGCESGGEALNPLIEQCVQKTFKDRLADPHWVLEIKRLIGEGAGPDGLLATWWESERQRWDDGWRWEKEEISFQQLCLPSWGIPLRGRIDRIDRNVVTGEVFCWDYKTGRLPHSHEICKQFLAPQLPIYLLALKTLPDLIEKEVKAYRAGYLGMKSEGEFTIQEPFKQAEEWEGCLQEWESMVSDAEKEILAGRFSVDPEPAPRGSDQGACTYCPYESICTYWKRF